MTDQAAEIAGVVIADATVPGFPLTYVSPGFEELTGYRAQEVIGGKCSILQGPETDPEAVAELSRAIAEGREAYVTLLNYRADGTSFWNEVALAPQRDESGRVVAYLGVQKDVTARLAAERRVRELAYFDTLTGLANRATVERELETAVRAAGSGGEVGLLFIDIDDFKHVNDVHGHLVGDELLLAVAERLRSVVRPRDLLARRGGDEVVILLTGGAALADRATQVAARVVGALREPTALSVGALRISASVGVSSYPRDATSAQDLLRHADHAMYVAKRSGKNAFHIHRSESGGARRLPSASASASASAFARAPAPPDLAELDRILETGLVQTVFQPIVEIASAETIAYEALSRGPRGSSLEWPDALFAAAHAAGRVVELDWLCRITAVQTALEAGLGRSRSLFLNCEPSALGEGCPARYAEIWSRALVELDLVLEITERALTDRPAELAAAVAAGRGEGCGIALDDLGADVRSLALLPFVEPDVIKLDLRLVQERPSTDQAAIVSAVAAERERTAAAVLAEGIETETHAAIARTLGATLGQGWLWGRPADLPPVRQATRHHRSVVRAQRTGSTPFAVVSPGRSIEVATKELLLPMTHHLEHRALKIGEGAVILSAFQDAVHFTPATARRYETLARTASLCAALGVGLSEEPARGVRGAPLAATDPLAGEWSVAVVGPHFAGALVARDLGDTGPDRERRFEFTTTYDRGLVIDAARTLMARIAPLRAKAPAGAPPAAPADERHRVGPRPHVRLSATRR